MQNHLKILSKSLLNNSLLDYSCQVDCLLDKYAEDKKPVGKEDICNWVKGLSDDEAAGFYWMGEIGGIAEYIATYIKSKCFKNIFDQSLCDKNSHNPQWCEAYKQTQKDYCDTQLNFDSAVQYLESLPSLYAKVDIDLSPGQEGVDPVNVKKAIAAVNRGLLCGSFSGLAKSMWPHQNLIDHLESSFGAAWNTLGLSPNFWALVLIKLKRAKAASTSTPFVVSAVYQISPNPLPMISSLGSEKGHPLYGKIDKYVKF